MSNFNAENNRAVWFDIPVRDLERSAAFYRAVLAIKVDIETMGDFSFAILEHKDGNGGCLVRDEAAISAQAGILLYLNASGRIRAAIDLVEKNGGKVVEPVHAIGPHGFRAVILDSEGNRVALHSHTDG